VRSDSTGKNHFHQPSTGVAVSDFRSAFVPNSFLDVLRRKIFVELVIVTATHLVSEKQLNVVTETV
jgi:hypothetical protein